MKLKELLLLTTEQKSNGFFIRGNRDCGEFKEYWDNERLWLHCFYLKGKKQGEYKSYYQNGQLCTHSFFLKDKKHGEGKEYWLNGQLMEHYLYLKGKCIKDYLE